MVESSTYYYFFSTIAQTFGAILGVVGLFAVFKLENLETKAEKVAKDILIQLHRKAIHPNGFPSELASILSSKIYYKDVRLVLNKIIARLVSDMRPEDFPSDCSVLFNTMRNQGSDGARIMLRLFGTSFNDANQLKYEILKRLASWNGLLADEEFHKIMQPQRALERFNEYVKDERKSIVSRVINKMVFEDTFQLRFDIEDCNGRAHCSEFPDYERNRIELDKFYISENNIKAKFKNLAQDTAILIGIAISLVSAGKIFGEGNEFLGLLEILLLVILCFSILRSTYLSIQSWVVADE